MAKNPVHNWTKEEDQFLIQHYQNQPKEFLMQYIPTVSWVALRNHARKYLGLSRQDRSDHKFWTSEEEDELLAKLKIMSAQETAEYFGVSYDKIIDKVHKMGYSVKEIQGWNWTNEEEIILKQHYEYAPREYLLDLLPKRNWNLITQHAKKHLGLTRYAKDRVYFNYRFFDEWTERSAYIFGFLLADGYVHLTNNSGTINVKVDIRDIDIVYKIAAALSFRGQISQTVRYDNRAQSHSHEVGISLYNRYCTMSLQNKDFTMEDKSHLAHFPSKVPQCYMKHLIRGLIDGDGWVSTKQIHEYNTIIVGLCGTYDVVKTVKDLIPIDISDICISQIKHSPKCFRWNVQGERAFRICEWLYEGADIYLDRKMNEYQAAKEKYAPSLEQSSEDTQ